MRFMKWAAAAAAIAGVALVSGCGGGGGSGNADIRLINASVGYSTLDFSVNGNTVGTAIAYGAASAYSNQDVNATTATLASNGATVLAPSLSSVVCSSRCSLIAFGWNGAISRVILQETYAQPAAGYTALNLQNLAPDAGPLDIYLTASPTAPLTSPIASNVAGGNGSGFIPVNVGASGATYTITITGYNAPTDVRLQIPNITLPALQVATLIATATPGGVLVNGVLAIQNGAVSAYTGTNARVRVVGTLLNNPIISATRAGQDLLDPQVTLAVGDYVTVPSGTTPVTMNLAPFSTPTVITSSSIPTNFVAGHDYTILVSGTQTAPIINTLDDDNRLPVAGTFKIRLTNGLSNAPAGQGVSLKLDSSTKASAVPAGTTSVPTVVTVTNLAQTISALSPLSTANQLNPVPSQILQSGAVYEVFMYGDATIPFNGTNAATPNVVQGQLNQLR